MTNDPPLSKIQNWLMTVMTSAGGVEAGIHVAKERFGLDVDAMIAHGVGEIGRASCRERVSVVV